MASKFISFLILIGMLLLGVCSVQMSHSMENMHMSADHECCDFSTAAHHETPDVIFLGMSVSVLPSVVLLLVLLTLAPVLKKASFEAPPLPDFFRRFSQGVLQLE